MLSGVCSQFTVALVIVIVHSYCNLSARPLLSLFHPPTTLVYIYSMYDPICDVIGCCVWSCDMGKINVCHKIVMKKRKKEKIWKLKKRIHKSLSKRRFWNGIYSLLMRADARESADTIYCMWRISILCGSGIVNDVTKVGHAQNIYYQRIVL